MFTLFKRSTAIFTIMLLVLSLSFGEAFSKGFSGGGGRSFSSGSSFRSSGSSFSKPSSSSSSSFFSSKSSTVSKPAAAAAVVTTSTTTPATKPSSFWNTSGQKATTVKSFKGTSSFDKQRAAELKTTKAATAKQEYQKSVQKFAKPVTPVYASSDAVKSSPVFQRVRPRSTDTYSTYSRSRDSYYGNSGWRAPTYVYQTSPSFGMWDGMMLWMMLDHMNDDKYARMAYNHSNDPGMQQWRAEANKLAESNAELKAKLAAMDAKVSTMTGEKDASYIPEGVPATVALSTEALAVAPKDTVPFTIATGSEGNNYARTGNLLKKDAAPSIGVTVRYTAGTGENLGLYSKKEVDGFIAQNDVMDSKALTDGQAVAKMKSKWMELFPEPVQMVSNVKGGIKSISDLSSNNILYVGPAGSGTESTWNRIKTVNRQYANVPTANATYAEALDIVANNPKAVMMFVSGLNSGTLTSAEARASKDGLRLVALNDSKFLDILDVSGNQLYSETEISSEVYPNLQKGMFFGGKDITTIACKAVFVVNPEWVEKNGEEALTDLTAAITESSATMNSILNRTSEN